MAEWRREEEQQLRLAARRISTAGLSTDGADGGEARGGVGHLAGVEDADVVEVASI